MVRSYTDQPVPPESIERILDAAVRAPSAGFSQGQRFIVVTDSDMRGAIAEAAGESDFVARGFNRWLSRAPVHIVICVDTQAYLGRYAESDKSGTDSWDVPYWWIDAGASLMAILYGAVDEGLAAGFLGGHAFTGLHSLLGIPGRIDIVGVVTIGHSAPDQRPRSLQKGRLPRDETVHHDHW